MRKLLLGGLVGSFVSCGFAWVHDAHGAIGMTAMSAIKGDALSQLKRLLRGRDAVDMAGWGHKVSDKYPAIEDLFYQIQPQLPENGDCAAAFQPEFCPNNICLTNSAKFFYSELIGRKDLAPKSFKMPKKLTMTDTDLLLFLIHVIGDMHQPMRFGFVDGGRSKMVKYIDAGNTKIVSLFDYWETELTQRLMRDRPQFWYSGWTHKNSLGAAVYEREKAKWDAALPEDKGTLFQEWANETAMIMCTKVERGWQAGTTNAETMKRIDPPVWSLTPANFAADYEFLKGRLLHAGARTAIVVNSLLASLDAPKLRQKGSGVIHHADAEYKMVLPNFAKKQKSGSPQLHWLKNLSINCSIIVAVAGLFYYLSRFFSGPKLLSANSPSKAKADTKFS